MDASVVVKWFLLEDHTESARSLLNEDFTLFAPDLVRAEVGNVMWKRWRRGDVSAEAAEEALHHLGRLPLRILTSRSLMATAWKVSEQFGRSFYDGLYVALAERTQSALVTADRKLYNALRESDLSGRLIWVEDLRFA